MTADLPQRPDACRIEYRVRYADCDPMGYLHHSRYFQLFEMARTELLRARGFRYRDLEAQGIFFVVYHAACTYRRPARYDDLLEITARLHRTTPARIEHSYEVRCEGRLLSEARTTLACVDRSGRPRPVPAEILA